MSTVAERVTDLTKRLQYAADDDAVAIEAAVLSAAATATRRRPGVLPPAVRSHSPERVAKARARTLAAYLDVRRELVADSLSTTEVARRLAISPAAVTKRRTAGRLVAFRFRGDWRYPSWQFADGALVAGVVEAWQALPKLADEVATVRWFVLPSRHLGDRTPVDALRAGDATAVIDAATYAGSR